MSEQVEQPACEHCRFWKNLPEIGESVGHCLRFPPQVYYIPEGEFVGEPNSDFPWVCKQEWCGEFQPKAKG